MVRSLFASLTLTLALPVALGAAEATCDGKLIVNGKTTKLSHVYAISQPTGSGETFIHVIFSDVPISDKDLALFPDVLLKEINDGKVHAIRLGLEGNGTFDATDIFDAAGWPTIKEGNKLELEKSDGKNIAGHLHLGKPYTDPGGTKWDYDIKFSAPLRDEAELNQ
ncbi:MAG: hypothetical protein LAO05_14260 [Acidobacteriia bacterium]|nr:hypothetical protein [Terriglobia bacterium]